MPIMVWRLLTFILSSGLMASHSVIAIMQSTEWPHRQGAWETTARKNCALAAHKGLQSRSNQRSISLTFRPMIYIKVHAKFTLSVTVKM
jgi:hypothetical protein